MSLTLGCYWIEWYEKIIDYYLVGFNISKFNKCTFPVPVHAKKGIFYRLKTTNDINLEKLKMHLLCKYVCIMQCTKPITCST